MQNDRNKINNGKKWNNEDGKNISFTFPLTSFAIQYMLMLNLKRNPPLTCKIEEKPSNQQNKQHNPLIRK